MPKETSYLHHLKFNEKLRNTFIAKYLANPRLVILLVVAVVALGTSSFASLPRRVTPEIKIPLIIVSTVLPGANPRDIESLITEPLEESISSVENISKVTSSSRENVSVIQIEFHTGVDPDKARTEVQSAIDQAELPADAQTSKVQTIDFENSPVWTFALIGKGDVASLNRFSTIVQRDLEDLPDIDHVSTGGLEEREISVIIDQGKLATYGLNPLQLSSLVKSALGSFPTGSVMTENSSFALSIDPAVTTIDDIRSLEINANGTVLPLSSIATITERSKPGQNPSYIASDTRTAERSVTFNVFKTRTANIDKAVRDAEKRVEESLSNYKDQFTVQTISSAGEEITKQFDHLVRDFVLTILLVFFVLFIFLGARQAVVSLFAVPLTFLISFTVMNLSGISLNFLSMFSLLLSLGLLVDDTIVVISAMTSYFRSRKFTSFQTGLLVWHDFLTPILTTTLTTVFAFLPILIATGIIGEFIKSIPIVVSSTLIASFGVAMLITLPFMIILLKPTFPHRVVILARILFIVLLLGLFVGMLPKNPIAIFLGFAALAAFLFVTAQIRQRLITDIKASLKQEQKTNPLVREAPRFIENGLISFERISNAYRKIIARILASKSNRRKAMAMVIFFSLFSYLLVPLGFVQNEFFPKSDQNSISMTVELPAGTNSETSTKEALRLIEELRTLENVDYVTADVGQATGIFGEAMVSESNTILFSFVLPDKEKRDQSSIEISQELRERFKSYTKGKITVTEVTGGPPAGADLQINLFGEELPILDQYADNIIAHLREQKGVTDVSKTIKAGTSKIVFVPDTQQLVTHNVTQEQLGLWLRTFASGFTLDSAKLSVGGLQSEDKQDITLRTATTLQRVEDISTISIPTQNGNVPLTSLGKLRLKANPTLITREDGKRTISVTATVQQGYTTTVLNAELEKYARNELKLPTGYTWKTGGVNEENQKSVTSILQAMLISFLLIIVTMVVQFGSFRKAVIVMLVIPLSISGVFIIFALTHTPLSFPALIGVLALFGIVVKNSILIVDKVAANERIGMDFVDGIIDGASSRLEPIALTSLAAIMGLIPITISDPLWRGLGGAIISGLTFSGTIMLFFIPVVYYTWFSSGMKTTHPRRKRFTSRGLKH